FHPGRIDNLGQPPASRAIADLIVILQVPQETWPTQVTARPAMMPLTITGYLAIKYARVGQRLCLISHTAKIFVVPMLLSQKQCMKRMMEIMAPLSVQAETTARRRQKQARVVQVAFRNQYQLTPEL